MKGTSAKLRAFSVAAGVCLLLALGLHYEHRAVDLLHLLEAEVEALGVWGAVLFSFVYCLSTALCFPGVPMMAVAATAFASQPWVAVLALSVGETMGQAISFFLARSFLRERVERAIGQKPWMAWLKAQVEISGGRGVFAVRLLPFFPQNLSNYAFGLTPIPFALYLKASFLGTLPLLVFSIGGFAGLVNVLKHGLWEGHPGWLFGFVLLAVAAAAVFGRKLRLGSAPPAPL